MVRALPQELYRVEAVGDEHAAVAAIEREAPQILVFSATKGSADLARRLHALENAADAYLLALIDATPSHKEITSLLNAGVHDFMRRPLLEGELLERVKAPERLLRWARSISRPCAFDFASAFDVRSLRAWRNLGALVAEDFSQLAGRPFTAAPRWPGHLAPDSAAATIAMSLPRDQLELRISVVADGPALAWIRETLLGDTAAEDDATRDALRELTNTAAGALKRAALTEGITLTTGMPCDDSASRFPGSHTCWSLTLAGGTPCLAVVAEIRSLSNIRISAANLTEGMVLAQDVRNEGGILLVPAGSRLTSTSAIRLALMLGPHYFLEVSPAA